MNEQRSREEARREGRIFARGKRGVLSIAWYADGRECRESTKSTDHRIAERKLRDKLTAKDKGETYIPGSGRVTLGQLLDALRDHHETQGTKSWPRLEQCSRHLREHFKADSRAGKIAYATLEKYVKLRRAKGAAAASIRLELSVLAQSFKIARKRGLLGTAPIFPTVPVSNVRTEHFTDAELSKLLEYLPSPVGAVVRFGAATGWRLMECLTLRWSAVDFTVGTIRLEPGHTKSGKGRVFPFGRFPALAALLEEQRQERWRIERERGIDVAHVFHRKGRAIRDLDDAWKAGCLKAELVNRRFHDLRRYAAMRLVQAGVARSEAMGLLGHETESMFNRYALNDLPALERAVEKLAALDGNASRA
jgi:integrase